MLRICAVYLSKKMVEEEYYDKLKTAKPDEKIEDKEVDKLLSISLNDLFSFFNLKFDEFFKTLNIISQMKKLSSFIVDDINSLINYYTFLLSLLEKFKKIFDCYFENFLRKIGKYENYFYTAWIIFTYFKKTFLMRKNDIIECKSTLVCVMNLLNQVFSLWIKKINFKATTLGSKEYYNTSFEYICQGNGARKN